MEYNSYTYCVVDQKMVGMLHEETVEPKCEDILF